MRTLLGCLVLMMATAAVTFGECPEAERAQLEALDRAWGEATQRGDRAHLQGIFADDFAGVAPTGVTAKAQTIENAMRDTERARMSGRPAPKVVYDSYVIACTPSTATITHRNLVTQTVDGKESTTQGRSIHFLEKRGGRWQVVSTTGHPLNDAGILLYVEREWAEADRSRDFAWFERNFADDFSGVNARAGALETKAEAIASMKKNTLDAVDLSDLDVRVDGNVGVVTGVYQVRGKDEKGAPFAEKGRFTDTFVKRDGRWVVLSSQGTVIK